MFYNYGNFYISKFVPQVASKVYTCYMHDSQETIKEISFFLLFSIPSFPVDMLQTLINTDYSVELSRHRVYQSN